MVVKDIRARDHQGVQDLQDKGYNAEIIWGKDWQALLTHQPEIKDRDYKRQVLVQFTTFTTTLVVRQCQTCKLVISLFYSFTNNFYL